MTTLYPYLVFEGRCEEAIEFYKLALGAKVEMLLRFSDAPDPPPPEMVPSGNGHKVMHSELRIGDSVMMATDGSCGGRGEFRGFSIAVNAPDEPTLNRWFAALSDGGQVTMPLGPTFWSPRFGMLTDRFGVGWMLGVQPPAA